MKPTLLVLLVTLATLFPAPPGLADDGPPIVANTTGGGWSAGAEHPRPRPAEQRLLEAKTAAWREYDALVASESASHRARRVLAVRHVGQNKSYYCGPASGVMIARYLRQGRSALTGAGLTQGNMANAAHMGTEQHDVTPYWEGDFTRGLNKWLYGRRADRWRYAQVDRPGVRLFRRALRFNIDRTTPIGVSTVELAGEDPNYNRHLYNGSDAIGHWVVARGYRHHTATVLLLDPATTVWPETSPRFAIASRRLIRSYVDYNGISAT